MAKSRAQKQEALTSIADLLEKATSVVFTGFNKLTVGEITATRKAMRGAGVTLRAVKKTLLHKAVESRGLGALPELSGQIALAYGDDSIAPAREVFTAGKRFEGKLTILGGIFEGALVDQVKMSTIAAIPAREVLLAQLVNIINSPVQRIVITLGAIAKSRN